MSKALIFDCDGVLADTELHGHLVAFNLMWQKFGVHVAMVTRTVRRET